jgi:uncharacterized protein (DUF302 family)
MSEATVAPGRTVPYGIGLRLDRGFDRVVEEVRAALADRGFGVLTEIDVRATMRAKLGVDVPAHVILGACNPQLALAALAAEPSLGLLLPCNVVVRQDQDAVIVEAIDPNVLVSFTGNAELGSVASEVSSRLGSVLDSLAAGETSP